ncbi:MAG: Na+/H+ antiporter subunit E [Quisquiliibacterium sp.]
MSKRALSLALALFLFWILLSGLYTPFFLTVGAVSALLIAWVSARAGLVDAESHTVEKLPALLGYNLWLILEIIKAGWAVSKIILNPALPISPTLVRFKPLQQSDLGRVIHANSITLTPGTITVDLRDGEFLVHGITRDGAQGCIDSEMDQRAAKLDH